MIDSLSDFLFELFDDMLFILCILSDSFSLSPFSSTFSHQSNIYLEFDLVVCLMNKSNTSLTASMLSDDLIAVRMLDYSKATIRF